MTPESELTKGAASTSQWWDVEVLKVTQDFAAVFKPAGLGTGAWERTSTSFAHVVQRRLATPMQPELCNRLGLHASGLQMVARSSEALEHFLSQRMAGKVCSEHLALVEGFVGLDGEPAEGVIDVPINIFQDSMGREVGGIVCSKDGQRAVTKYKLLRRWCVPATTDDTRFWGKSRWFSLVQIRTLTDRLNQIQAHLAFIGHPLVCDCRYGAANFEMDSAVAPRLFLHHARIEFEDMHGQNFAAASELAPDLQAALLRIVELAGELEASEGGEGGLSSKTATTITITTTTTAATITTACEAAGEAAVAQALPRGGSAWTAPPSRALVAVSVILYFIIVVGFGVIGCCFAYFIFILSPKCI
ncbi:unnamed protein product [Polarella glacialis]|uniref:Pseudouridine synthase RsuA/RluA-like domain-containing protein n=1 Tax=Polarella glacialis TaxID=89957 RepID=A0A813L9Q3_POLGL|nr:unnamed protein product [Polarella glacialis]CAE8723444.1 unnamed protein product [Polarella glacialis]